MKITTREFFEDQKITKELKVLTSHATWGMGLLTMIALFFCTLFGIKTNMYDEKITRAKEHAVKEIIEKAQKNGANAIVNLDIKVTFMTVYISGLAVIIENTSASVVETAE